MLYLTITINIARLEWQFTNQLPSPSHTLRTILSLSLTHTPTGISPFLSLSFSSPMAISLSLSNRYRCHSSRRSSSTLLGCHCGHCCGRRPLVALHCGSSLLHNGTHGCHGRHVPQGQTIALRDRWRGKVGQVSKKIVIYYIFIDTLPPFLL